MKNLEISKFKIAWKWLTGGKEAVLDYLLEIGNRAVLQLPGATKDKAKKIYDAIRTVHSRIVRLEWAVPLSWRDDYDRVLVCIAAILDALEDGQVTREELGIIIDRFNAAYKMWRE